MTRSSTKELYTPLDNPKRVFHSRRKLFETSGLEELSSPEFDSLSDIEERIEEKTTKAMTETMEEYMSKPMVIMDHEDANEHIEKVLEIVDLFHILNITQDQLMLRVFAVSLTGAQEPNETLFRGWERFKELLMKYPQHYLTEMQEVILFYNGLDVPTKQILDSKGVVPTMTVADAKKAIQQMAEYSQKWHNGTSTKTRSAETSDGMVGCELCKGSHYTKDCPLKEEGKTLEEAYYIQFAKRHEENSNIIKEIRASTDATIRNQGASLKTLEIQIGQMSKVLQKKGFRSLPSSTKINPRDHVKSISTAEADLTKIRRIGSGPYAVSDSQFNNIFFEPFQIVPFSRCLHDYCCDERKEARELKVLETYSIRTTLHNNTLPQKEKDLRSFTLPYFILNVCFDKSLTDLGASIIKHPRGIAENVLVRIDDHFLSTAHAKIDVFKRKITLRVGEEKIVFKSIKPTTSVIRRVYMLKERTNPDSNTKLKAEALNGSLDPLYGDYIELNDLTVLLEPRNDQDNDFEPTIDASMVVNESTNGKIHFECCYKMKFSCMIGYKHVHADLFPLLNFSIIFGFAIVDDMDVYCKNRTSDVVLSMPFCKKFVSRQMIMEKFICGDGYEQIKE
ncbi:retrovirus-related pol polyprotein from transposon TNT 1-94 [Tanacetum coccineum]